MKRFAIAAALCFITSCVHAKSQGEIGALFVHGSLEVSGFSLKMESPWQEVSFGSAPVSARTVPMALYLQDVPEDMLPQRNRGDYHAGKERAIYQARLTAPTRLLDSSLIAVQGDEEVGIKMRDNFGRMLNLSGRGAIIPLTSGNQVVNFSLTQESRSSGESSKTYHSLATLNLDYF
ncbi:hypothetical protein INF73_21845 [Enterobacter cloacae complex sp. P6RS]|uniref:fimbrial protein n=1 Tax=unclassified Enterobacter cloacae complex TaxID=2757714 RepID=UPI001874D64F|nr:MULTISPECIES: hypothetical protein [unclassified Enterobacter cloacae complex]MBE4916811.1 hypothetical protein [Enterobacter cloacae complex sp. P4RS]MBE4994520.1 hypothetical protein [Enterobacter cloacae complex sp. P6RS]